jgi:hypothetical protein
MTARNRELFALVPVAILLTAGFAAVFAQETDELGNLSLIYGAYFLALCLVTHVFLRIRLPNADPYLFPLMATLTAFGLVMIYRIDESLARDQANWFVLGLVLFAVTIWFLRDYEVLERLVEKPSNAARAGVALGGASLAVEMFAWSDRHHGDGLAEAFHTPGREIQRHWATKEPTPEQLEVAVAALEEILRVEEGGNGAAASPPPAA